MSIELIEINGQSEFFDYEKFKNTCESTIGKTCSDAKIFVFNNFPAAVSSETNIHLILVLAINPKKGNYYRVWKNERWVYLNNLILPINFANYLQNEEIKVEDNQIICNEEYIDYSTEINSLRFSFIDYLALKCGFNKQELFIQPIIFIKNKTSAILDNYIVSEEFTFNSLNEYLLKNSFDIFISNKNWKSEFGYENIADDIKKITEQASKDSEIGYLTKKKIDRIGKQLSSTKKIYDELDQNLIIINGKAGTGKSSELLTLTLKCISNGQNTLFLTYNKLLIFDIAKTVKSFINAKSNSKQEEKPGEGSVLTLHAFFYRLSKSLGVLHVLSANRIEKLLSVLKVRMRINYDYLLQKIDFTKQNDFESIKTNIQNNQEFDNGTKEIGIEFLNYINHKPLSNLNDFIKYSKSFYERKKRLISSIEAKDVFIADYYGVLENTLLQIEQPEVFFEKYDIENKHELLDVAIGLNKKYIDEKDGKSIIKMSGFKEFNNRRIGSRKRKRTVFIDEAQDCHRFEKEILISIYGSKKIVIASGGKEQLIRHVELCNWEVSKGNKLETNKHYKRNKSYRVKKTVGEFCNYVANHYKIDLNLEPIESEDEGELLVDFNTKHTDNAIQDIFKQLNLKGEINGCSAYERLLILIEANSQREGLNKNEIIESGIINEYGNIEASSNLIRGKWKYLKPLKNNNLMFWDGTESDKSKLIVPSSFESRLIYYESCRGLESWSVACFSIDKFFKLKKEDPDAEKFLLTEEKGDTMNLFLTNEERRNMFAATWVLMALTRVIDTLYIQLDDENSEFGKVVKKYLEIAKTNVKEIKPVANNVYKK